MAKLVSRAVWGRETRGPSPLTLTNIDISDVPGTDDSPKVVLLGPTPRSGAHGGDFVRRE